MEETQYYPEVSKSKCVCGLEGRKRCAKCKAQRYCSTNCQKGHWKEHKLNCSINSKLKLSDKNYYSAKGLLMKPKKGSSNKEKYNEQLDSYRKKDLFLRRVKSIIKDTIREKIKINKKKFLFLWLDFRTASMRKWRKIYLIIHSTRNSTYVMACIDYPIHKITKTFTCDKSTHLLGEHKKDFKIKIESVKFYKELILI